MALGWNNVINSTGLPQLSDAQPPMVRAIGPDAALAALPAVSRKRLVLLRERRDEAAYAADGLSARRFELHQDLMTLDAGRRRMIAGNGGRPLRADDPAIQLANEKVSAARDAYEKANRRHQEMVIASGPLRTLLARLDAWLGKQNGVTFTPVVVEPEMQRGESPQDAIARIRARIKAIAAEITQVRSAPLPRAAAKARHDAVIDALATRGRIFYSSFTTPDGDGQLHPPTGILAFNEGRVTEVIDAVGLLAFFCGNEMKKRGHAEIDALIDDKTALTPEARAKREGELMREMLALEREECCLIEQAEKQGFLIPYRGDCSPLAVLALAAT